MASDLAGFFRSCLIVSVLIDARSNLFWAYLKLVVLLPAFWLSSVVLACDNKVTNQPTNLKKTLM